MFPALLFYLNPLLTHTSSLLLQSGGSRIQASAAGGPGGERANGDPGGEGGDMAGGVPTHQNPDQRGANHHPPGAAGPRGHCTSGYGEDAGGGRGGLWKLEACLYADMWASISVDITHCGAYMSVIMQDAQILTQQQAFEYELPPFA